MVSRAARTVQVTLQGRNRKHVARCALRFRPFRGNQKNFRALQFGTALYAAIHSEKRRRKRGQSFNGAKSFEPAVELLDMLFQSQISHQLLKEFIVVVN
jgi:hypothetical protein